MSGLPDEAVEAMARAIYHRAHGDEPLLSFDETPRSLLKMYFDLAEAALPALPAGVYVSDGQGHVTYRTEDETARAMAARLADIPILRRGDFTDHGLVRLLLAALSATDTERTRRCSCPTIGSEGPDPGCLIHGGLSATDTEKVSE